MKDFEKKIGYIFKNKELLQTALTHRSFVNEQEGTHNERLEFLGDAILQFVSTDFLFKQYEDLDEGKLSAIRAALVNKSNLSVVATDLNILELVRLSRGRTPLFQGGGEVIGADTVESLIGAIYIDSDLDTARKFIEKFILSKLDEIMEQGSWIDAKTKLQEKLQADLHITPLYKTIKEEGKEHKRNFVVVVYCNKEEIGRGSGSSKQKAQQTAAENALQHYKK